MRIKIFCGALLLLMLNAIVVFGQSEPCAGTDVDTSCPLDTWVMIFAFAALIFAAIHLYHKRDALNG